MDTYIYIDGTFIFDTKFIILGIKKTFNASYLTDQVNIKISLFVIHLLRIANKQ